MPRTLYNGPAVAVPKHFVGLHTFAYPLGQWGGAASAPPSFNYGAIRMHDYEWWRNIEQSPGVYDWSRLDALANANQERLLILVAFGTPTFHKDPASPFISRDNYPSWPDAGAWPKLAAIAAFAKAACTRYREHPGGIAFEVWNEGTDENYFAGWDNGADAAGWLGQMTKAVFAAVKSVDASIPVLGVSNVNGEGRAQAYAAACRANGVTPDGVCYHFYGATPVDYAGRIRSIKSAFAAGGLNVPIWDTEHGYVGNDIGDSEQAMKELLCIGAVEGVQSFVAFGWENPYDASANITPGLARGMQWAQDNLAGRNITRIVVEDNGSITVTASGVVEPPPPPPPVADDGGTGTGLHYTSWPTLDLSGPNDGPPELTGASQEWDDIDMSARLEGFIEAPESGNINNINLRVTADDGVRVWLDDALVLDEWRQQAPTTFLLPVWPAVAGQRRKLRIEYFNQQWQGGQGSALLRLEWQYGDLAWHTVGSGRLFPPTESPQPAACALPWGGTIAHGASVTAYQSASVPNGQQCVSELRVCNNGVLSGSFQNQSCAVEPPAPPTDDLAARVTALETRANTQGEMLSSTLSDIAELLQSDSEMATRLGALEASLIALRDKLRSV